MKKIIVLIMLVFVTLTGCVNMNTSPNANSQSESELEPVTENVNSVKNTISFGHYGNEEIQWIPVNSNEVSTMLVSECILDYKPFNDSTVVKSCEWKNSTLRAWLNSEFLLSAFTSEEQNMIISTNVQDYLADGKLGDVTSDKVFILSKNEAWGIFTSDDDRSTIATTYAKTTTKYPNDSYWLIDSYSSGLYKYLISPSGDIKNNPRVNETEGVRPVIWVQNQAINMQ